MWRRVWSSVVAFAWIVGAPAAIADDGPSLALPAAMPPEALAKESARGEPVNAESEAVAEADQAQANASAQATVGPITINGPVTTGNVGSFPDGTGQISTGIGNIQQGVSAVVILN
jgi:hypothetical protein